MPSMIISHFGLKTVSANGTCNGSKTLNNHKSHECIRKWIHENENIEK